MTDTIKGVGSWLAGWVRALFWVVLLYWAIQQACSPYWTQAARVQLLEGLQQQRNSRVIAMIHRQETLSLFGVPMSSYIDIEDSEQVLRAIRLTPPEQSIDLILHTPGGLVLATSQIALALLSHEGKVTVFVPHYAMSGGTLLALAADEIVMDPNGVLGPVDPQLGGQPAASILKLLESKKPSEISDEMLVAIDVATKARQQVTSFVKEILLKRMPEAKAQSLAAELSEGRWTHDFPITVEMARQLGLTVSTEMPSAIYQLMDLYPQGEGRRPSVLYVPLQPPHSPVTSPQQQ